MLVWWADSTWLSIFLHSSTRTPHSPLQPCLLGSFRWLLHTKERGTLALPLEWEKQPGTDRDSDLPFFYLFAFVYSCACLTSSWYQTSFPKTPHLIFLGQDLSLKPGFTSAARLGGQWVSGNLPGGCTPHLAFTWCHRFKLRSSYFPSKRFLDWAVFPAP